MTRTELHSITGFHPASLVAAATHLRATMNRKRAGSDPTAIINNEGRMNGYMDALDDLVAAASQQAPKPEKSSFQPYSQPQNETPNKQ